MDYLSGDKQGYFFKEMTKEVNNLETRRTWALKKNPCLSPER